MKVYGLQHVHTMEDSGEEVKLIRVCVGEAESTFRLMSGQAGFHAPEELLGVKLLARLPPIANHKRVAFR